MKDKVKQAIVNAKFENILPKAIREIRIGNKLLSTYIIEAQLKLHNAL